MSTVLDEAVLEERPEIDLSALAASLRVDRHETFVLGIDIGTSGFRAALFNRRGDQIDGSQISLGSEFAELTSGSDVNVDRLLRSIESGLDVAVAQAETFTSHIDYVAVSCFWHSLLGVDESGEPITPLFGWADTRAAQAVAQLRLQFDEPQTHQRTGARFHPSYWPAKLLWLKTERPEVFAKAKSWLSFSDYLFHRLLGDESTSISMASGTGLFNQRTCSWDADLPGELGLSAESLPPIAAAGHTVRQLTAQYAGRWPLLDTAAWFPAIGDGAANNIGAGCVTADRAALMIGTSGAMRVLSVGIPASLPPELFCYRADRDRIVIGGALSDGGGLYRWMNDSLTLDRDEDELEAAIGSIPPDSHGLTVLPFWSGERATGWSPSATGTIVGLTARTKPIEILRATIEAVCYRFALLAAALQTICDYKTIVATGNALVRSRVWRQILADVLGKPIELSTINEPSMRGAALLALEAIGKIDSLETIEALSGEVIEPDLARHEIYARAVERQQQLYEKLIGRNPTVREGAGH